MSIMPNRTTALRRCVFEMAGAAAAVVDVHEVATAVMNAVP
jgi:hypothetical protein